MNLLSLDIGKKGGYCVYACDTDKYLIADAFGFSSMKDTYDFLKDNITKYSIRLIIIGEAMGQRHTVKQHSKFYGIAELVAEENKINVLYVTDITARKIVLPPEYYYSKTELTKKGIPKVRKGQDAKQGVMDYFSESNSDIADSMLFAKWYKIQTSNMN